LSRRGPPTGDQPRQEVDAVTPRLRGIGQSGEVASLLAKLVHAGAREVTVFARQVLLRDDKCFGLAVKLQEQVDVYFRRECAPFGRGGLDLVAEVLQAGFHISAI